MQVHDVPLLINGGYQTVTYTVGAGVGVFYDPQPGTGDGLRTSNSATFVAANGSFTVSRPVYVVAETKNATADLRVGEAAASQASGVAASTDMATVEELFGSAYERARIISTDGDTYPCFFAPFALRLTAFYMGLTSGTVTASDTDYWTCTLQKFPNVATTSPVVIATKTTRGNANGGEGMTLNKAWGFDASVFDLTNMIFAKGDMLRVLWNKTLAPANITAPLYTWRYEPI